MIKAESWGRHHCFDGDLRRRMVAFLGLAGGEGNDEGTLGCCRKRRRSRRGPSSVVAETVELPEKGDRNEGGTREKSCVDCGSTKTPLWRGGPAGPKTLCNACGIRCRKMKRKCSNGGNGSNSAMGEVRREEEEKVMRQRQRKKQEALWRLLEQSRKFRSVCGEEEADAAVLLMALSTGVFLH